MSPGKRWAPLTLCSVHLILYACADSSLSHSVFLLSVWISEFRFLNLADGVVQRTRSN